ncbi:hypothetical protein [Acidovorax temperans]|uniref:hypothetical protein n=1 Tax=Acidovorax temperans TaxID=80878 RepID=UPI0005C8C68F|nr:hypothetical protein [Acidovorax temperans]
MKKNVLALSIAAMIGGLGFAGVASAVVIPGGGAANSVDPVVDYADATKNKMALTNATALSVTTGGTGHNLIVPYFTVQDGNMTVIHLTNTDTVNGKAVKVRFRGAANSDDLLDFQVLMSPGDVWTAAVTAAADGTAQLSTADGTCTVPSLKGVTQKFDTRRLPTSVGAAGTREGYVEIFNMADISGKDLYTVGTTTSTKSALYTAIKHVNGVAPCTATVIEPIMLKKDHTEETAVKAGFNTPTTGLMGDWYIINVAKTTTFSGAATAVTAVVSGTDSTAAKGNFVVFPQLADAVGATIDNFTADPLLRTANIGTTKTAAGVASVAPTTVPAIEAAFYDLPDLSTPYVVAGGTATAPITQAEILTGALAVKTITNQYATDAGISAKTDWVFSMPTRRYSVALDYRQTTPSRVYTNGIVGDTDPATAGVQAGAYFHASNTSLDSGKICVTSDKQAFYDREETTKTAGAVFSPGAVDKARFCGETSILSFGTSTSGVLGAALAAQFTETAAYTNGWGVIDVTNGNVGLPILGSAFIKLTNPQASAGVSGNYGITWPHRFTK